MYRVLGASGGDNKRSHGGVCRIVESAKQVEETAPHGYQIQLWITSSAAMTSPHDINDGKLKPGIYRIQNLRSEKYLDIHIHSREVCCRAERELQKGRGLVRLQSPPTICCLHISDNRQWEIMPLGIGYAIKMVNFPIRFDRLSTIRRSMLRRRRLGRTGTTGPVL